MKKAGYPAHYAGAIEACASTGGVLLPPIMGSTAFVMATFLQVPYYEVAVAAAFAVVGKQVVAAKPVARCKSCNREEAEADPKSQGGPKYTAIPKEEERGRGLFRCPGGKQVGCNSHGSKRALCECPAPPNASSAT